jgi:opacity protein-like surface antigen
MRKVLISTLVIIAATALVASAGGLNVTHGGIRAGYIAPEDPIDATVGFGAEVGFGIVDVPNFSFALEGNYWAKSYSEDILGSTWDWTFSDMNICLSGRYEFSAASEVIHPYIGAGAGFHMVKVESETILGSLSATDNKFGGHAFGGFKVPVSPVVNFFAEGRYTMVDPDYLGIYGGLTYSFMK